MSCLSPEQAGRVARNELRPDEAEGLGRHLDGCERCRRQIDDILANDPLLKAIRQSPGCVPSGEAQEQTALVGPAMEPRLAPAQPDSSLIDSLPGYQIIREIHRGAQGVVYEAVQAGTDRTVAVKVMLEGPFAGVRSRWRFEREVRLIARLKHPNIVAIHDSGIAEGRYYFAMDYVRGQPLDTHVRLAAPPIRELVRLFVEVCDAVSYAHRHGVIHRDLKPSNILVGEDGKPQLLDFGLAKIITEETRQPHDVSITRPGQIMGTLQYMSPEQTMGDQDAVDARTDIYTLGVILYELLARRAPYETHLELTAAIKNIREADPPKLTKIRREVNSELEAVVRRAVHKEPDRRYESAGLLAEDLRCWLDGRPVTAKSDSSFYVLRKLAARHYFHTSVVFALIAALVGFGGITFYALSRARQKTREVEGINQQFAARERDSIDNFKALPATQRSRLLAMFLAEWRVDCMDGAKGIQAMLDAATPEYAVMAFLLDESITPEQLAARLPANAASLALLATGERYLKAGRRAEAKAAFEKYVSTDQGDWRVLAESRLRQLSTGVSGE